MKKEIMNIKEIININEETIRRACLGLLKNDLFCRVLASPTIGEFCNPPWTPPYGKYSGYMDMPNDYEVLASVDESGRVIINKRKNAIYRGIFSRYARKYEHIYNVCKEHNLIGNYIVDTKIANLFLNDEFGLIFEHQYIRPLTYFWEWSPCMLYDAARSILDLIEKLDMLNFGLKDVHLDNFSFYKGNFVLIDFGSIITRKTPQDVILRYFQNVLYPLILKRAGKEKVSPTFYREIAVHMNVYENIQYQNLFRKCLYLANRGLIVPCCNELRKFIDNITANSTALNTVWSSYQDKRFRNIDNVNELGKRERIIYDFVESIRPERVLDIGGNSGWFGFCLREVIDQYILAENDSSCVDKAYLHLKRSEDKRFMTPLLFNVVSPNRYYDSESVYTAMLERSSKERLKSDCVLALALIHHLVFNQRLNFANIINQLSDYSTKYLIVEFIDPKDKYVKKWMNKSFSWYNYENFRAELEKKFSIISYNDKYSGSAQKRCLLICKKNDM